MPCRSMQLPLGLLCRPSYSQMQSKCIKAHTRHYNKNTSYYLLDVTSVFCPELWIGVVAA